MNNRELNTFTVFQYIMLVLFLFLAGQLYYHQIFKGDEYEQIAINNYVRIVKTKPIRGQIFDCNQRPLVINIPSLNLYLAPDKVDESAPDLADFVCSWLPVERAAMDKALARGKVRLYEEQLLYQNMDQETYFRMAEYLDRYPALEFRVETSRNYMLANHFTGHVGRISEDEYAQYKDQGYQSDDLLGKTGLEKQYEAVLRGVPGHRVVQVDATGRSLNFFRHNLEKKAQNGADLLLYLNVDLQKELESQFPAGMRGAAAVIDIKSGGILAYVSKPDFDPNIFLNPISQAVWDSLTLNPDKPMLDRLVQGTYPPGSTFKPLTGFCGLESGVITDQSRLAYCDGGMYIGKTYFHCWSRIGHGRSNLYEGMAHSCDVYFYDLSQKLNLDFFHDYVIRSHLARKTGVDLPNERNGFFPTPTWYYKTYGRHISVRGRQANLSIGQGEVLVTPLQIAAYYAALARNGKYIPPHFLHMTMGGEYQSYDNLYPYQEEYLPATPEHMAQIQEALYRVINGGTGGAANVPGVKTWGKTGSAENHAGSVTHAWFAGYSAWDGPPEIAFVIFFENAGHGGSIGAPIARDIIRFYGEKVRKVNQY